MVEDVECAQRAFLNNSLATRHNHDGTGKFTYIIVTDDVSGILGMAEFPQSVPESAPELMVLIDSKGLRNWGTSNKERDLTYDEGDTCVHEGGHSLGLFHTFENGCTDDGDMVSDTSPEAFPSYICEDSKSCQSTSSAPVHNFMDYSPDTCMMGFTE